MLANLLLLAVLAQVPPAPPAPPVPLETIESLVEKINGLRAQQAEIKKAEDALLALVRARFKDLTDKVNGLGAAPTPAPPMDKLAQDLVSLYAKESSASKKTQVLTLASLYKQAAKEAASPLCENCADLAALILSFIENAEGLGADAVKPIRDRVLAELRAVAPSLDAPLNDTLRQSIGSVYSRAAAILEGVAK